MLLLKNRYWVLYACFPFSYFHLNKVIYCKIWVYLCWTIFNYLGTVPFCPVLKTWKDRAASLGCFRIWVFKKSSWNQCWPPILPSSVSCTNEILVKFNVTKMIHYFSWCFSFLKCFVVFWRIMSLRLILFVTVTSGDLTYL